MEPVLAGGDPGWIRTIDLPLRRRPLYPLSYEAKDLRGLSPKNPFYATVLGDSPLEKKRGSEFGPPLPLWVHCVWVESLQAALDITEGPNRLR